MNDFIIDTTANLIKPSNSINRDPYDHLGDEEWVQKQIEYGSNIEVISGKGLVPFIQKLEGELIGCEIGICHGFTTKFFLDNIPNIKKLYAVDHYPSFVDWDGSRLTEGRQQLTKQKCRERLSNYKNVEFFYESSLDFHEKLEDYSLDFIFIDGNHSYETSLKDFKNYWSKVKIGGIFAGHDIGLSSIQRAINDSFDDEYKNKINVVENNAWFFIKE